MKIHMLAAFVAGGIATAMVIQDEPKLKTPASIAEEHHEIHEALVKATRVEGAVGDAAKAVAKVLHAHFEREEEIAMPPLGLLQAVAQGKVTPDMKEAVKLTDQLKEELPKMLKEHVAIKEAVGKLSAAAREAKNADVERLAHQLSLHARNEEEVLYPAAIVLGEYLKLKLK